MFKNFCITFKLHLFSMNNWYPCYSFLFKNIQFALVLRAVNSVFLIFISISSCFFDYQRFLIFQYFFAVKSVINEAFTLNVLIVFLFLLLIRLGKKFQDFLNEMKCKEINKTAFINSMCANLYVWVCVCKTIQMHWSLKRGWLDYIDIGSYF